MTHDGFGGEGWSTRSEGLSARLAVGGFAPVWRGGRVQ